MTTQPSPSRFPWIAVIAAGLLALAGVGLLVFAVVSITLLPAAPARAPAATAKSATQIIAQSNATAVVIPTITVAPQAAATQAVGATAAPNAPAATTAPNAPAATAAPTTAAPATAASTADLNLKILQPANVRSGPGVVYPIISSVQAGASVPVDGRDASGQWYAISAGTAVQGWISAALASYGGDVSALPVIAAPPTPIPTRVPPTPVPPPTAAPVATNPPAPVGYSSHGIVGVSFAVSNPNANAGDQVWFGFTVTNSSNTVVEYSALAAHTDGGPTAWSWTMQKLNPGQTLEWRDNLKFPNPGTYQLYLGICFAGSVEACKTAGWDHLSPNVTVTIN